MYILSDWNPHCCRCLLSPRTEDAALDGFSGHGSVQRVRGLQQPPPQTLQVDMILIIITQMILSLYEQLWSL